MSCIGSLYDSGRAAGRPGDRRARGDRAVKLKRWFRRRGPEFIVRRAGALLGRYGVTPTRSEARIRATVALLAEYGCAPTFPTPGRGVQWHPHFIESLQAAGAEIAVHSFDHLDLKGYPPEEACEQLLKGAEVFERHGIEVCGFRCPYLSWSEGLLDALPAGRFGYSSNEAVWWDAAPLAGVKVDGPVLAKLTEFYEPRRAQSATSVPHTWRGLVEIPVCLPDDLQLHDGLKLGTEAIGAVWTDVLQQTHRRGEAFTLMFHPELAERYEGAFRTLLEQARRLQPHVWLARLRDIGDWWAEKACFSAEAMPVPGGWRITFASSERATILGRGLATDLPGGRDGAEVWWGPYSRLQGPVVEVAGEVLPFVGLPSGTPESSVVFLREQGYIVKSGELAERCAIQVDGTTQAGLKSEVELIDHIENCAGPLVRFWRWPDGARSALSITGDLDAVSLVDYAPRLWVR